MDLEKSSDSKDSTIEELKKENERLKGKVKDAWYCGFYENRSYPAKLWEEWSKENKI